jgi:glycosyltransferase involved in cell wall biosynthesis
MSRGRLLFMADAASVHTRRWVEAMVRRGFHCTVLSRNAGDIAGADVVVVRAGSDAAGWFRSLRQVRRLAAQLQPACIHGHYATSYGMWAAACRQSAPIVVTAWGSDILVTPREPGWRGSVIRKVLGWTLRRADLITADAADVLEEIARYGVVAPLHEVLWGVDTSRFRPASGATADPSRFDIVSLRQWEPNYRIDLVLRAFAVLRRSRPALHSRLMLLGGGSMDASLRALAAQLDLGPEAVQFVGRVDDAGLVAALGHADLSVSVPASDATSVAVLESMACGLPVIATDLPANRRWIDAEWRVPVDDVAALAAALVRLGDDAEVRRAVGSRNRSVILGCAARDTHMDRMAALYESLFAVPGRSAA